MADSLPSGTTNGTFLDLGVLPGGYKTAFTGGLTFSVWANIKSTGGTAYSRLIDLGPTSGQNDELCIRRDNTNANMTAELRNGSAQNNFIATGYWSPGAYHHYVMTYNGSSSVTVYKDGIPLTGAIPAIAAAAGRVVGRFGMGGVGDGNPPILAALDQPEISNVARSADWIKLSYKSQKNNVTPLYDFAYSPATYQAGTTVSNIPAITGNATRYTISGPGVSSAATFLTATGGLNFSTSTGAIYGVPKALLPSTNYTITAYSDSAWTATNTISLQITAAPPTNLLYPASVTYEVGTPITTVTPTVDTNGPSISYSISPSLPSGLSFNTATGAISGTPTSSSTATPYSVTATNTVGSSTPFVITITVNDVEDYTDTLAWTRRTTLTLNTTVSGASVTAGAAAKVPVLVRLNSNHRTIFQNALAGGADIRFANSTGTHLPYQIERWSTISTDTSAAIWVLADNVAANDLTTIRMYWGNGSVTSRSNGSAVFDFGNSFRGVWHLGDSTTIDPRPNAIAGAPSAVPSNDFAANTYGGGAGTYVIPNGIIGKADSVRGSGTRNTPVSTSDYLNIGTGVSNGTTPFTGNSTYTGYDNFSTGFTYSVWEKAATQPNNFTYLLELANTSGDQDNIQVFHPTTAATTLRFQNDYGVTSGGTPTSSATLATGSFQHLVVTVGTGATPLVTMYRNGAVILAATAQTQPFSNALRSNAWIAKSNYNDPFFNGVIDEPEISSVARDPNWIKLSYKTQRAAAAPLFDASYRTQAPVYAISTPITADTFFVTGTFSRCTIVPATLPAGLAFNTTNCIVSGTPTALSPPTNYTVTAYTDSAWSASTVLNLAVNGNPTELSYPASLTYESGTAITPVTPYVAASSLTYSILPDLTANTGLNFDVATGVISGTPTITSSATDYIVTATNGFGTVLDTVNIAVLDAENYADWASFKNLTLNTATAGAGVTTLQSNFPVLVRLNSKHLPVFQGAGTGGSSIRFSSSTGKHLPYQIESWSFQTGDTSAVMWVLADTITGSGTTTVRMHWGNGAASRSDGKNVFATGAGFVGVWHLGEATGDTARDVTTNRFNGTPSNSGVFVGNSVPVDSIGIVGRSKSFRQSGGTSGAYFVMNGTAPGSVNTTAASSPVHFNYGSSFTISAWVRQYVATTGLIVSKGDGNYQLARRNSGGNWSFNVNTTTASATAPGRDITSAVLSTWVHLTGVRCGTCTSSDTTVIYLNGVAAGANSATGVAGPGSNVYPLTLGRDPSSTATRYFGGAMDEVEMSAVARSADWVKLTYRNQKPAANPLFDLNYSAVSPSFVQGSLITPDSVASITGSPNRYAIDSLLPTGLLFSTSTGKITGTPSIRFFPGRNYTVTAFGDSAWSTTATINVQVLTPPSALKYLTIDSTATGAIYGINVDIGTHTPTVTGDATHYSISPALPAGLSMDTVSGVISGTSTVASPATVYTITVNNNSGASTTVQRTITVLAVPSALTYVRETAYFGVGVSSTPDTAVPTGTIQNYSISPALPTGLSINALTGIISGNPTGITPATDYEVTGTNAAGSIMDTVSIRTMLVPSALTYSENPAEYPKSVVITPDSPSVTGDIFNYSVLPALPTGLIIDSLTGIISGTPAHETVTANYVVTAANPVGLTKDTVIITIVSGPPFGLRYSANPAIFGINVPAIVDSPAVDSGAVTHYAITPALPAGLSIHPISGLISGTPTVLSSPTDYLVTASNHSGEDTETVNIRVVPPPTALSYGYEASLFTSGTPITPDTPTVTNIVQNYSVSPTLPVGLSLNSLTGVITGTPTGPFSALNYTVTATNVAGSTSVILAFTVYGAPDSLAYHTNPVVFGKNVLATPDTPSFIGEISNFTISPALPSGLTFSNTTGIISGTATVASAASNYLVIGTNYLGSDSIIVNLSVVNPIDSVRHATVAASYKVGTAITPDTIRVFATAPVQPVTFTADSLPPGLSLDGSTGIITGAPTAQHALSNYVITAHNAANTVVAPDWAVATFHQPSGVHYTADTAIFYRNVAITSDTIVHPDSILITHYSVLPPLPAGLVIDSLTGTISGAATGAAAVQNYVVTASNPVGSTTTTARFTVYDAPTGLTYAANPAIFGKNIAIANDSPTVTNMVTHYAVDSLPTGLVIDSNTGVISGTPTVATFATNYVVTASNPAGADLDTVNIRVLNAPDDLTYGYQAAFLGVGVSIANDSPTVTAVAPYTPVNYTVDSLPPGLAINSLTGVISGTPTSPRISAIYTVTVHNAGGSVSRGLNFVVLAAPTGLSYKHNPVVYGQTVAITPDSVATVTGTVMHYAAASLPAGLVIDTLTGVISGTPTTASVSTPYVISASNVAGSTYDTLHITVLAAPTALTYATNPAIYWDGVAIANNSPTVTGTVTLYSVSSLPTGLHIDSLTGVISGTPSGASIGNYVVTASNIGGSDTETVNITVKVAPSALSYVSPVTYGVTIPIVNDSPTVTGTVTHYSAGSLPAGLVIDSLTGVISGTPTTASSAQNYVVTASNPAGSTNANVNIRVLAAPTGLTYSTMSGAYLLNTAITANNPSVTGTVTHYSVAPSLPAGLALDTVSGIITGTPTVGQPTNNYTVTGSNIAGSTNVVLTISVLDPPTNLTYARLTAPVTRGVGIAFMPDTPTVTGVVSLYSIAPSLTPIGLSISASTGIISGTPTAPKAATNYVITATNAAGSTKDTVNIRVLAAPSGLTYSSNISVYGLGLAITDNTPSVSAPVLGMATHFVVAPGLPAGLTLDTVTGVISGTPTVAQDTASYTVTASNIAGSTPKILKIAIVNAPTLLTYSAASATYWVGTAITSDTASLTAVFPYAPVTYTKDLLPAGLSIDSVTGIISGIPTTPSSATNYHITATNAAGNAPATLNFTVNSAPSNLSYARNTDTEWVNVVVPNDSPTVTGVVLHYSVSPPLPVGMSLDSVTGVISGTPTTAVSATNYTVTASNPATPGSTTKQISIVVYGAPTTLSYSANPVVYGVNVPIPPDTASVTGTILKHYSATLPPGLSIDSLTGLITGIPTLVHADSDYIVTGTNPAGQDTEAVHITVLGVPTALAYSPNPAVFYVGALDSTSASVTGTVSYSSVTLPAGLTLNSTTGLIKGTPTTVSGNTPYLVTASNIAGNDTETVQITVRAAPTNLSYTPSSIVLGVGTALVPVDSPHVTGTVTHYAINPTLPAGLALDSISGVLSGTPTIGTPATNYTVTGSNPAGSTTAPLTVTTIASPLNLTYTQQTALFGLNTAITPDTPSTSNASSAPVTQYSINPPLPTGLSIHANTGIISGTPTVTASLASYVVTATNIAGSTTDTLHFTVLAPPANLSYPYSVPVYAVNAAITPDTPSSTGGAVTHYAITPALPAGLTLDSVSGILSGTPTAGSPSTNYTVSASNPAGTATAPLTITVIPLPAGLVYTNNHPVFRTNVLITPDTPTVTVGPVTHYAVSPALPTGLSMNASSGIITGTPTVVVYPESSFVITASNVAGNTKDTLRISVLTVLSGLTYSSNTAVYGKDIPIATNIASIVGTVPHYAVLPGLPAGLSLDSLSGAITGIPTAASTNSNYVVTATNAVSSTNDTLHITVLAAPTALSYASNPAVYGVNVAIAANNPAVTGTVTTYSVDALPAGLSISPSTGIISGTPTVVSSATNYLVTATNIAGSDTETVRFTVLAPPSGLSYSPNSVVYLVGDTTVHNTPTVTGTVTHYSVSPALPAGIQLDSVSGLISGIPTADTHTNNYTVTASNVAGSTTKVLTITVFARPANLHYAANPAIFGVGVAANDTPIVTGTVTQYSVSPALPAALSININTGAITGIPSAPFAASNFVVIATNAAGSDTDTVSITALAAPTGLSYSAHTPVYGVGVAIAVDSPTVTGTVQHYAVSPALSDSLHIDSLTGIISGIPRVPLATTRYIITASNVAGSVTDSVFITVGDTAPAFHYSAATISATKNVAIAADTIIKTGTGAITNYALNGGSTLPTGLSLNSLTGAITGTPTVTFASTIDTVIATGPGGTGNAIVTVAVADTSPSISYKRLTIAGTKNVAILADTVVLTGTGAITTYAISPVLPSGLSMDSLTGIISGTPTAPLASTPDTVTATGPGGTGKVVLTISVSDTAPAISYLRSSISGVKNVTILADTVVVTGTGAITSYSISPVLPAGLYIDSLTGVISGAASATAALSNYTVTATGPGGNGNSVVSIVVADTAPSISYASATISATKNVAITADTIIKTGTGAITSYALKSGSTLPTGLSLSLSTGAISGTPTVTFASKIDTVIATGPGGTGTAVVTVAVADTSPSISYKRASINGIKNVAILADTIVINGTGAITGYALSGGSTLPTGLSLSLSTGVISGTPTVGFSSTIDTVIATGPGGTGTATVTVAVADTAPSITYLRSAITGVKNVAILADTIVITGTGTITGYSLSGGSVLPAGLSLSPSTGEISGTPTATYGAANDTVIATGPGGTGRAVVNIAVGDTSPAIAYVRSSISGVKNVAILADTIVVNGTGAITGYSLSGGSTLPAGLSLSLSTGVISGTPTASYASKMDTVIATGPGGTGRATVTIAVGDTAPSISYKRSSISGTKNAAILSDTVVVTGSGTISGYSVSPVLPAGLHIDSLTGEISGTPTIPVSSANYTVSATGPGGVGISVVAIAVSDTSPSISYKRASISGIRNVAILSDTVVVTGTGAISGYSVSPTLPTGLHIDSLTGEISGTATVTASSANYTVSATGPGGVGTSVVTVSVSDTAPSISYKRASISGTKNVAILSDTIVVNGPGAITGYALSGGSTLPAGVSFNLSTGEISGTPTATFASKLDTVIATGPGGTGIAMVTIAVGDTSPAISYKRASISGVKNVAILSDTVVVAGTGAITGYSVSPTLPTGLHIDSLTGEISGTATVISSSANYTVSATGPGGVGTSIVAIAVSDTSPAISYKRASITGTRNVNITPDTVIILGTGSISGYSVSPSLPAGLSLSSSTGLISGAPTVSTSGNFTVSATGPGGVGTSVVSISVSDTAPSISYQRSTITATKNVAIAPDSVVLTGTGAISSYSVSPLLPAGLNLNLSTGVISGTPTGVSSSAPYTVSATGPGGVGNSVVTIAVIDTTPVISYVRATINGTKNVAITPDTAVSTGGVVTSYSVGSALPAGLVIDSLTGRISGIPSGISASAPYTVSATGPGGVGTSVVTIAIGDTAPSISYVRATISGTKNVAITPDTAVSVGGAVTGYSVSPALPSGLVIDSLTGVISGTVAAIISSTPYTVTATGPGGTGVSVVTLAIGDTAPSISYKSATIAAVRGTAITPDTAVSVGGAVTVYHVSPSLPAGLSLDTTTGILSGTATVASASANYTVTAMGPGGTGVSVVSISVVDNSPIIAYVRSSISGIKNVAITPDTATNTGGAVTVYSVSPALPSGLVLDTVTGRISGTPSGVSASANYTVTATGPGGSGNSVVSIAIQDTNPVVSYRNTPVIYARNVAIAPDSVNSTGGSVTHYSVTPALPAGLVLDTITGVISGTPTATSLAANYAVTYSGPGGSDITLVNIRVVAPPTNLSYPDDPVTYVVGLNSTPNTPSVTGYVTHYAITPGLPAGLHMDSVSGIISGIPTIQSFAASYTVTASSLAGSTTYTLSIAVVGAPSNLSYPDDVPTYALNQTITPPNTPTVTGIVTIYTITPALPAGITLDQTTGYIQGTPTAAAATTTYTITGANPGGTTTTTVILTVIAP